MIDDFDLSQMIEPLHMWFETHARILPWRDDPTPYRVWISEIMLQQTRVEAVKSYYERFMKQIADVKTLAEYPDDDLMKLWEGLGYYNRARNLKVAAGQIMNEYQGQFPNQYEELLHLKGIGHYTAGAIASIAYGIPVPAVDGNVLRVISRVCADDSDIMKQSVRTHMEQVLRTLMEQHKDLSPKIFNQALMELGAIVCVPNGEPHCEECPLYEICEARRQGRIGELPVKKKAKNRRMEERTVLVIKDGKRVAIHKRPDKGLLAGLYELPNYDTHLTSEKVLEMVKEQGLEPLQIHPLEEAKHIFSHIEWHMKGYLVQIADMLLTQPEHNETKTEWFFVEKKDVQKHYAIPTAFATYIKYME